jgi:uncharacterized protein
MFFLLVIDREDRCERRLLPNFVKNALDCKWKLPRPSVESGLILCKDLFIFGLLKGALLAEPIRQCMACRRRDSKQNFLRIVRTPSGAITFDPEQKLAGRGAYLCAENRCLSNSRAAGLFGLQLHRPDPSSLYLTVAEHLQGRRVSSVESLVGFAVRAGRCVFGVEAVEIETIRGRIRLLVLSEDVGSDTGRKMTALAARQTIPLVVFKGERSLGDVVGKPNCRILGIKDSKFAAAIRSAAASHRPNDARTSNSDRSGPEQPREAG